LKTIFVSGTAGSGKSLLSSKLHEYYTKNGAFAAVLNLDPGVENLAYTCDVEIDEIQNDVNKVNPDYLIVDTPGQIELFAYRSSGRFIIENLTSEEKSSIFLFDGVLINTPVNFVSIALLATSIRLRLNLPTINVLTKSDLIGDKLKDILEWSTNLKTLENAIAKDTDGDTYTLTTNILRGLNLGGFAQGLIPISNVTGDGFVNLEGAMSRILNLGEEVED